MWYNWHIFWFCNWMWVITAFALPAGTWHLTSGKEWLTLYMHCALRSVEAKQHTVVESLVCDTLFIELCLFYQQWNRLQMTVSSDITCPNNVSPDTNPNKRSEDLIWYMLQELEVWRSMFWSQQQCRPLWPALPSPAFTLIQHPSCVWQWNLQPQVERLPSLTISCIKI